MCRNLSCVEGKFDSLFARPGNLVDAYLHLSMLDSTLKKKSGGN